MFNWRVLMEQDMAFITASSVGGFFLCALLANKVFELSNCCRIWANFPDKQTLSTCKSPHSGFYPLFALSHSHILANFRKFLYQWTIQSGSFILLSVEIWAHVGTIFIMIRSKILVLFWAQYWWRWTFLGCNLSGNK